MNLINTEWTKLDKENQIVELTYSMNNKVLAKLTFDYKKDTTQTVGNLYDLVGWNHTDEDNNKYKEYIEVQKMFSKEILKNVK